MESTQPGLELNPASLPIGAQVGAWRVLGWRGRGSYGVVYRVERVGEEAAGAFALKLALHSEDQRFDREAALLSRIDHPNVPRLRERGFWRNLTGTFPYLVMDWVEGVPLYEWAARDNLTSRQALRVLAQVARALEATHAAGGVHRDVKGDNVLVRPEDGRAFLMDFGVGDYRGAATLTPWVLPPQTPPYRSPEAWEYEQLFAQHPTAHYEAYSCDDLFALGVTAYRLVTGRYPPPTNPQEPGSQVWKRGGTGPRSPRVLNKRVAPLLETIILKLLSVVPIERFKGSAQRAAEGLEQAAEREGPEGDVPLLVPKEGRFTAPAEEEEALRVEPPAGAGEPRPVEAQVPVPAPVHPRPAPPSRWGPWHTLTTLGLALILVTAREPVRPAHVVVTPRVPENDLGEESHEGGTSAVGDEASAVPGAPKKPPLAGKRIGLNIPKDPLKGQRRPPCDEDDYEIRGGCWYKLKDKPPKCSPKSYEWQGDCYKPIYLPPREATSDSP
ncbi:MAG TPA: serine/threonine-protein kinase [Myxococcaceae bacterium]|nr:serine/threonine-protein kinase [Myxococcaceae bacterium]